MEEIVPVIEITQVETQTLDIRMPGMPNFQRAIRIRLHLRPAGRQESRPTDWYTVSLSGAQGMQAQLAREIAVALSAAPSGKPLSRH